MPNVIWIDEDGIIVRPPEPGWAAPVQYPEWLSSRLEEQVRKAREDAEAEGREPVDRGAPWAVVRTAIPTPTPSATGRVTGRQAASR